MFEPPIDGTYLFTVYAVTLYVDGPVYIKNNDAVLCQAYIPQGGEDETGTCTVIAQLAAGNSV